MELPPNPWQGEGGADQEYAEESSDGSRKYGSYGGECAEANGAPRQDVLQ